MSEQEHKPPNESFPPPPVVNPLSSRSDKNLKAKKTTRTMNPKSTNTMKHHDMLNESTDVNVKKILTRSSSKIGDSALRNDDMEFTDDGGEGLEGMNDLVYGSSVSDMGLSTEGQGGVVEKDMGSKEGVCGNETECSVSAFYPELSSSVLGKINIDKSCSNVNIPEIPSTVEHNPVLNSLPSKQTSDKSGSMVDGVSNYSDLGKESYVVGNTNVTRDVDMQDRNGTRKPLLFSNVVQGANYSRSNKLRMVPCAMNEGCGRASYARVLVEVDADNGIVDNVEVWYKKLNRSMKLRVEYAWQPPLCSHCCVFGHSFEKCVVRVVSDDEKAAKSGGKLQTNVNVNDMQQREEGWQTVHDKNTTRNYTESVPSQTQYNNPYGGGTVRGGMYMGRGGPSFRGRGGFNGKGNSSMNTEMVLLLTGMEINNGKGENLVYEEMKKQGIEKENGKTNDAHLNHIGQKDFSTRNRYSVLDGEKDNEESDEWKNFCARIDMICKKGAMIDEDEKLTWSAKMLDYYSFRWKKCNEKALAADVGLKSRIDKLKKYIGLGAKFLHENAKKIAEQRIIDECDGIRRQSSYNLFYSQAYETELKKIKQMKWQKDMLEVDLFVNSKQSVTESIKEFWSNDMVKYYENVCDKRRNDRTDAHCCE
ncbi:zinc knuckle CX2CX4HX4C [Artemisia annua]|uniref:Zinc knuckle CX2CX4HX4C n=1 Tax=Artemisia annua TaxID=35608 RepID=A0A2U1KRZ2_ARTAN|nr:zinc knuckle CX2CX4HX4C [Artemisia annua]